MVVVVVISAGLSDFHDLVKAKSKQIIYYRDYKNVDDQVFQDDLTSNLRVDVQNKTFLKSQTTFLDVLEKHAPFKNEMFVPMKYTI